MQIKYVKIDNFKSLVDFELPLAKFNCLVGLNGSGKSTVLQFFDFLSQQMRGDLSGWLENRQWEPADLNSKLTRKKNISFEILLSLQAHLDQEIELKWSASFNRQTLHCTMEMIEWNHQPLLKVEDGNYRMWSFNNSWENIGGSLHFYKVRHEIFSAGKITFDYQGSLLSGFKESQLSKELLGLKNFFIYSHALDLLSPELLRQRTKKAGNSLGLGGERLSAFLHEMGAEKRSEIQAKLAKIYPQFKQFNLSSLPAGWKKLTIQEQFSDSIIKTEARHVADGFLRMLAIFAQLSKYQSFLLLDEIENGINPELIEVLIDELVAAKSQVLVTTHSPMVLNYLEDEIAINGVIYIYKKPNGASQAIRLFDIPRMREKLTVMGPGEVYEDTLLTQLDREIMESH
jgi:predicted ATPase